MRTIFGTNRNVRSSGRLASSEYAIVTVGGRSELGQSVQGTYQRTIETIHELGSTGVLWVPGFESGSLQFQRLVGSGGFFAGWNGDACGRITPVSIDIGGGGCVAVSAGGLRFSDTVIESLNFSMQAGSVQISEGVNLRVGSMSRG